MSIWPIVDSPLSHRGGVTTVLIRYEDGEQNRIVYTRSWAETDYGCTECGLAVREPTTHTRWHTRTDPQFNAKEIA